MRKEISYEQALKYRDMIYPDGFKFNPKGAAEAFSDYNGSKVIYSAMISKDRNGSVAKFAKKCGDMLNEFWVL